MDLENADRDPLFGVGMRLARQRAQRPIVVSGGVTCKTGRRTVIVVGSRPCSIGQVRGDRFIRSHPCAAGAMPQRLQRPATVASDHATVTLSCRHLHTASGTAAWFVRQSIKNPITAWWPCLSSRGCCSRACWRGCADALVADMAARRCCFATTLCAWAAPPQIRLCAS